MAFKRNWIYLKTSETINRMGQTKKAKVTFTCEDEIKSYLTQWAQSENRTLSNLIETLVTDVIEGRKQEQDVSMPDSTESKKK